MKILKFNPQKSKAQAMVEFAIVLPILLLVVYGLIEVGRLIFIVASVNNATRQAARYGSTSGVGPNGIARYLDCNGIRAEVQRLDFLNIIDDADIDISYDHGTTGSEFGNCNGSSYVPTSGSLVPVTNDRVVVFVDAQFDTILPLVPIDPQPIEAESSRTLLLTISIEPPKKPTTTIITSDAPDHSLIGQSVAVTVTVTADGSIPTGSVTITGADTSNCPPLSAGTTTCTAIFNSTGTKTITATYNGDTNHDISSDTESHTVKAVTNTTIVDYPDPSLPNETVNVVVTVTSTWAGTPTGRVTITGADSSNCPPLSGGTTTCTVTFATQGIKTLAATYSGDAEYDTSGDTESHDVVLPGVTVTTITSDSPDQSLVGQSVTVSVAVTGSPTPTGAVDITGADTNCSLTLSGGTGSCNVVFNSLGAKTLTATYTPDTPAFLGSSDTEGHTVGLPLATVTITSDTPDPSAPGGTVNVTVTVTGGSTTPTGTVAITGADTNCTITLSAGTGNCNVVFNTSGSKTLTATYSGDSTHGANTDTETHSVSAVVAPPIPNCNTLSVAIHLSKLKMLSNGNMAINITNPFSSLLQISTVKVSWNHDKGHQTGDDKTLILNKMNLGTTLIWSGNELGPDAPIIPSTTADIPANSTSTLEFIFHQIFDRWDNTESVEFFFANPGCGSVSLKQTVHE